MDSFDKIAGTYQPSGNANSMTGQPWRVGKVTSVNPYKVDVAGIIYEGEQLFINWIFQLRNWECEAIDLPSHPEDGPFTERNGYVKFKQEALISAGDTVVVLLVDDQTAYLMAKVVPA